QQVGVDANRAALLRTDERHRFVSLCGNWGTVLRRSSPASPGTCCYTECKLCGERAVSGPRVCVRACAPFGQARRSCVDSSMRVSDSMRGLSAQAMPARVPRHLGWKRTHPGIWTKRKEAPGWHRPFAAGGECREGIARMYIFWMNGFAAQNRRGSTAQRAIVVGAMSSTGKVEPMDPWVIRAELATFVAKVSAVEGRAVKKGQLLLELDVKDAVAQLAQAHANRLRAEDDLRAARAGGRA